MFEPVQLGRYECYERVGTTAYGEVLRARVAGAAVEKHFLVRRLAGAVADDGSARRRFVLAATALMPIEDPRLVAVIEARDVPGGDCFVAMEDVSGVTLERLLPVSPDAAALVMREVGEALKVLASRRRAHGAVSASNVLITSEGDVKLGDAGLQAALKGETVTPEVDTQALETLGKLLGATGDPQKGKAELAARVTKMLAPPTQSQLQPKIAPVAQAQGQAQAAAVAQVEIPVTTGRLIKVPPRPLWMKIAPVVALAGIGVAAWKLLPQRKQQVASAAAPAPKEEPPPPPPKPEPKPAPVAVPTPPPTPAPAEPKPAPAEPAVALAPEPEPTPLAVPTHHSSREVALKVRCHAKGLRVVVDGKPTGVTCPADYRTIKASEGPHTVAIVRSSGGAPVSQQKVIVKPHNHGTKVYFKD